MATTFIPSGQAAASPMTGASNPAAGSGGQGNLLMPAEQMPLIDASGMLTPPWRQFFQNLFARVGGNVAFDNAVLTRLAVMPRPVFIGDDGSAEEPSMIPGPQGIPGPNGTPGPAIGFLLEDQPEDPHSAALSSTRLDAQSLQNYTWAVPNALGTTKPNAGTFTQVTTPIVGAAAGSSLTIQSNGTTWATMDASGNLGLATVTPGTRLDVAGNVRLSAANPVVEFNNGGPKLYSPAANIMSFAVSGLIGSPTEVMRIDNNGNLGVGNATPGTRLDVFGNIRLSASTPIVEFNNGGPKVYSSIANTISFASGGTLAAPVEAMRLDSAGNLWCAGASANSVPVLVTTATYTMAATDSTLIFNLSATNCTLTLPNAATYSGRWVHVKTITAWAVNSATANVAPINSLTAGTAILPATAGKWAVLQSDGTNWHIMAAN